MDDVKKQLEMVFLEDTSNSAGNKIQQLIVENNKQKEIQLRNMHKCKMIKNLCYWKKNFKMWLTNMGTINLAAQLDKRNTN